MEYSIYTIGHSTHPIEKLINLLNMNSIEAVCDVRSSPYSRVNPQYNRETLRATLRDRGFAYVFLGDELGARPADQACYRNGKIQYDLLAKTASFRRGLERVIGGSRKFRIALMCAEKDPLQCHRTILIARKLVERGIPVRHILSSGDIETHEEAEERLLRILNLEVPELFRSRDDQLREAYWKQSEAIAYTIE